MQAGEAKLEGYLEGTKQYVVPLFQRPYSWDQSQWRNLWNDIEELCEAQHKRPHFLGSVVAMPAISVPEGVTKYLLIDGQQRLTTIIILLAVLRDIAKSVALTSLAEEIEKTLLVNPYKTGTDFFKLQPTQADRPAFQAIFKADSHPVPGSRIAKAYSFFDRVVKRSGRDIASLKSVVSSRLTVVSIVLDSSDNPFLVFEGLNAKGMPLTQADLVRNYFVMQVHQDQHDEVYGKLWKPMEDSLKQNLTEFIRHFLMRKGSDIKQNEIYVGLKDEVSPANVIEYMKTMGRFGSYYARFLEPSKEPDPSIAVHLARMKRLDITFCYPLMLSLYDIYDRKVISASELASSIRLVENFILRRFICGVPTQGLQRLFASLAHSVPQENVSAWLAEQLAPRSCPGDAAVTTALPTLRLYGAGERTEKGRLILEAIEESYGHKERPPLRGLTIEHVMPQTLTPEWQSELGAQNEQIHGTWLHTLGNLTLTAYNPELSNAPFQRKKNIYGESNLELNKYFAPIATWGETDIQARAAALSMKILEIWPSFSPNLGTETAVGDPIDVEDDEDDDAPRQARTPSSAIEAKRASLTAAMSARLKVPLKKVGKQTVFEDSSRTVSCCCVVSKRYQNQDLDYWYALHSSWLLAMKSAKKGFYVLGCMDQPFAFAIPYSVIDEVLPQLNRSELEGRPPYWHIKLFEVAGKFFLRLAGTGNTRSVEEFRIELAG